MDLLLGIFSAFGLSASAGLNAYIPLLVIGVIAHYTNLIKLNPPYDALANPYILILIGILLIIEMLADKVPGRESHQRSDPNFCATGGRSDCLRGQYQHHHWHQSDHCISLRIAGRGKRARGQIRSCPPYRHGHNRRRGKRSGQRCGRYYFNGCISFVHSRSDRYCHSGYHCHRISNMVVGTPNE